MANSIFFKVKLKGNGIVNFDSSDQKYALKRCGIGLPDGLNDNYKFGKKAYFKNENGDMTFVPKISADCIRHEIFGIVQHPALTSSDIELCDFLSNMMVLMRGWLFTMNGDAIRRASALRESCALETSGAVPVLEACANSENKELTETSLHYSESLGNTEYMLKGIIDFKTLEFLTCDVLSDCRGFKEDWIRGDDALLNVAFENRYGKIPYKAGFYTSEDTTLSDFFAEYGIKFDIEFCKQMIKEFFKRILKLRIERATGYAEIDSLYIKFNNNPYVDRLNDDENGWIKLEYNDVDSLDFDMKDYFIEVVEKERGAKRQQLEASCQEIKDKIKKKRDDKKAKKDEKKSSKSKKNNDKQEEA